MEMLKCRSCGAPIRFMTLTTGRRMPVDLGLIKTFLVPAEPGAGEAPFRLVTERGGLWRGRESSLTDPTAEPVEGYRSHWDTCTGEKG